MAWFRGFLFLVVMNGAALVLSATELLIFWAPHRWRWAVAVAWANVCLWAGRIICGLDVSTEGSENIPDEPCVFLIKHTTSLETYWQIAALPPSAWVLKKELLRLPVFGWAVGIVMQAIAIDRSAGGSAVKQVIAQGKERIASGLSVSIFPEGTRMPPGAVAHNAGDLWPKGVMAKSPGKIRFCIGPPIDPGDRSPKETNVIAQEWVESKMSEISSLYKEKARED
jgi:1-acyl-sn-glycerol-3-phosphate acyltransferase